LDEAGRRDKPGFQKHVICGRPIPAALSFADNAQAAPTPQTLTAPLIRWKRFHKFTEPAEKLPSGAKAPMVKRL